MDTFPITSCSGNKEETGNGALVQMRLIDKLLRMKGNIPYAVISSYFRIELNRIICRTSYNNSLIQVSAILLQYEESPQGSIDNDIYTTTIDRISRSRPHIWEELTTLVDMLPQLK